MHMNTGRQEKVICIVMLVKNKKRKKRGKSAEKVRNFLVKKGGKLVLSKVSK